MNQSLCLGVLMATLLLVAAGDATAQGAPAGTAPAKDAKDSKESKEAKDAKAAEAEAMERARRLAANPMRIILEASRVRRKGDAEPAPNPIVPVVASTATAPAGVVAAPAAEPTPRSAPPVPAPTPVREAPPPAPPAAVISSELTQTRVGPAPAPALEAPTPVARAVATPAPAVPALAALPAELSRPTLVRRVDPEVPARLLADIESNTVISADLTIRPDGSVAQVNLVSQNTRALGRYVVAALQQWRFAPLPAERVWRIDLLFRSDE